MFHVVRRHQGATNEYENTRQHFWPCASSKHAFFELTCCTLSLLDQTWESQNASYMDFSGVIATTMNTLVETLRRLPVGVTPSALSFSPPQIQPEEQYMTLDVVS